jgi:hypothetical protein
MILDAKLMDILAYCDAMILLLRGQQSGEKLRSDTPHVQVHH